MEGALGWVQQDSRTRADAGRALLATTFRLAVSPPGEESSDGLTKAWLTRSRRHMRI